MSKIVKSAKLPNGYFYFKGLTIKVKNVQPRECFSLVGNPHDIYMFLRPRLVSADCVNIDTLEHVNILLNNDIFAFYEVEILMPSAPRRKLMLDTMSQVRREGPDITFLNSSGHRYHTLAARGKDSFCLCLNLEKWHSVSLPWDCPVYPLPESYYDITITKMLPVCLPSI